MIRNKTVGNDEWKPETDFISDGKYKIRKQQGPLLELATLMGEQPWMWCCRFIYYLLMKEIKKA